MRSDGSHSVDDVGEEPGGVGGGQRLHTQLVDDGRLVFEVLALVQVGGAGELFAVDLCRDRDYAEHERVIASFA
jgi:hypothetical protein